MWDFHLYAVNVLLPLVNKKKLLWPMTGQNIARQEIQAKDRGGKKAESGRCYVAPEGERCQNLTSKKSKLSIHCGIKSRTSFSKKHVLRLIF